MQLFWLILGWVAAILGAIGLFLPVVPTVPSGSPGCTTWPSASPMAQSSRWA